jgi:hypothetical protein
MSWIDCVVYSSAMLGSYSNLSSNQPVKCQLFKLNTGLVSCLDISPIDKLREKREGYGNSLILRGSGRGAQALLEAEDLNRWLQFGETVLWADGPGFSAKR